MSRFPELIDNLFLRGGSWRDPQIYNRMFVVSAYAGITDLLLEHKHSGEPGVFSLFSDGDDDSEWPARLAEVGRKMCEINAAIYDDQAALREANVFVEARIEDVRRCLEDVQRLCSFGQFDIAAYLARVKEMLSSMGEAHSAFNAAALLRGRGVEARFIDLTGWKDNRCLSLDERIEEGLSRIDVSKQMPIVTGYAQCEEGMVRQWDRGYTEITMSRVAVLTRAREAVIHKEYHLSSADPKIVGGKASIPIGRTNYDVADQLSNLGMEAIHPGAAKRLRQQGIPLRVKNSFEPDHTGTLIDSAYKSDEPKVEIIAGRRGLMAIELFDQDMMGRQLDYERRVMEVLERHKAKPVGKDVNANSITHYVASSLKVTKRVATQLEELFPNAIVDLKKLAFVSAVGSDLDMPGLLALCSGALGASGVQVLSAAQPLRGVDVRFVVEEKDYAKAVKSLHDAVITERGGRIAEQAA